MNVPKRQLLLLAVAIAIAIGTAVTISFSLDHLRDSIAFYRLLDKVERDRMYALLDDAARLARRPKEWRDLLALAWVAEDDQRLSRVEQLSELAIHRFPDDPRWRTLLAYALSSRGAFDRARAVVDEHPRALNQDEQTLLQLTALYAYVGEGQPRDSSLTAMQDARQPLVVEVASAIEERGSDRLWDAWERTGVRAIAANAAVSAGREGTTPSTFDRVRVVKELASKQGFSDPITSLYLSIWTDDELWYRDTLMAMEPQATTTPRALALQAEHRLAQGSFDQARRLWREVRRVAPQFDAAIYLNDAAVSVRDEQWSVVPTLREAIERYPNDGRVRLALAGGLVESGDRLSAARVLSTPSTAVPTLSGSDATDLGERRWFFARVVLGSHSPPQRVVSDLWEYLNDYPDSRYVGTYLAHILTVYRDTAGLLRLVRRYEGGDHLPWFAAVLTTFALSRNDPAAAERALMDVEERWETRYNRALFAVRHLSWPEAYAAIESLLTPMPEELTPPERSIERESAAYLLLAEYHRLRGDTRTAATTVERALVRNPRSTQLEGYAALLAPAF